MSKDQDYENALHRLERDSEILFGFLESAAQSMVDENGQVMNPDFNILVSHESVKSMRLSLKILREHKSHFKLK